MSIQSLPFEVLLEILRHVSKPTLINCAAVCKLWCEPATRLIYENVTLSSNPKRVYDHFEKYQDEVGNLVKNLKFGYGNVELSREEFGELLCYLRFVKVIDLQFSPYKSNYLTHMDLIGVDDHCLQYLQDLNVGSLVNAPEWNKYFRVLYNCRKSLKVLKLYRVLTTYQIQDQPDKSFMYYLHEFTNLTHLAIINNPQDNGDPQLSLLYTLKSCPKLVDLSFENAFEVDEETEMDLISDARPSNTGGLLTRADSTFEITQSLSSATLSSQSSPSSHQTINVSPTLKDLKKIDLKLKNITGLQVKSMLSYLPNSLNIFKLRITGTATGIWIQRISENTLKQLGEFLCRVNQVDISFSSYTREEYTGGEIPNSSEVMSKFFPLMDFIVGDRQLLHSYACINVTHMGGFKFNPNITIKRNQNSMTTTYEMGCEELSARLSPAAEQYTDPIHLLVPQSKFGGKLSYKMTMLTTIEIVSYEGNIEHAKYIGLIQSAVKTCPRLRFFIITTTGNGSRHNGDCSLKFGCVPNVCDIRSSRSLYRELDNPYNNTLDIEEESSMTTKERIKYVLLENAQTTMASIKLIADSLPHLKELKIVGCHLEEDEYRNTTLDLRGAQHVEKLLLDIAFTGRNRRHIFFKVESYAAEQQEEPPQVKCYVAEGSNRVNSVPKGFQETTPKYLNAYRRFESTHSSTIVVKCQKLSQIGVSYGNDMVLFPLDIEYVTADSDSSS